MSDHLPECPHSEPDLNPGFLVMCICDRLRACEQRVYDERNEAWVKKCRASERHALDAAREAVENVNWFNDNGQMMSAIVATADALAAIDALLEERK